jgi:hypothetical protein
MTASQPMKPGGPVQQPYAGVNFIPSVKDNEFGYKLSSSVYHSYYSLVLILKIQIKTHIPTLVAPGVI